MKHSRLALIAAAAALATAPAAAGILFVSEDAAGTEAHLLEEHGPCIAPARSAMFYRTPGAAPIPGCWLVDASSESVHIVWFNVGLGRVPLVALKRPKSS